MVRELDGVSDQGVEHAAETIRVAFEARLHRIRQLNVKRDPLVVRAGPMKIRGCADRAGQLERETIRGREFGLRAGQVENVAEQDVHLPRRPLDDSHQFGLAGVQERPRKNVRHARHAVQGRADLVAHVGQELALRAAPRLGRPEGRAQGILIPLQTGDVDAGGDDPSVRRQQVLDPDPAPLAELVDR